MGAREASRSWRFSGPEFGEVLMSQFEPAAQRIRAGTTVRGGTVRTVVVLELFGLFSQFGLRVEP